jgi:hypothetical protein
MIEIKRPRGKLAVVGALGLALSLSLTGCGSISSAVKSVLAEDTFPTLPSPEITTYILDLSVSTNPLAQLNALNSGIDEFASGKSLGNPFSNPKIKPRGLSMQFITLSSGQAPRFLLVSAEASQELYNWMIENSPNIDQAQPLWNGFIRAREIIYSDKMYQNMNTCPGEVIKLFGQQAQSSEALRFPAIQICKDAQKTARSLQALTRFNDSPGISMGSDVFGAIKLAINNMITASEQFQSASMTIAIASDMVDENPNRKLHSRLGMSDVDACNLGKDYSIEDYGDQLVLSNFKIILVGLGNTTIYKGIIEKNRKFWNCYFETAGAEVNEATDLAGY